MRGRLLMAAAIACLAADVARERPAHAEPLPAPTAVIELFTSQGCSSCPPADIAFADLARRNDILALAYHVDYWNYLGWTDTLGSPENTARQYAYARALRRAGVFTPQFIVNGRAEIRTGEAGEVKERVATMGRQGRGLMVPVSLERRGNGIRVRVGGAGSGKAEEDRQTAAIHAVYFTDTSEVTIAKGENAGRTLVYHHAVTAFETVGLWDGAAMTLDLPASVLNDRSLDLDEHRADRSHGPASPSKDGLAIIVQQPDASGNPGPILGAGWIMAATHP